MLSYLESILGLNDDPSPVSSHRNKSSKNRHRGSRGVGRNSELQEVKKANTVVPSTHPISRVTPMGSYEGGHLAAICDLESVGWSTEEDDLGFPRRPDWRTLGLDSADALHAHEEASFQDWLTQTEAVGKLTSISTFERNLEFWRELWRVIERGDIYLIVVDARNPLLHLDRSFLSYLSP